MATLRFERTRRAASLVDLDDGAPRAGDLCHHHALTVTLPRGWVLSDRRSVVLATVATEARPRTRPTSQPQPQPHVDAEIDAEVQTDPGIDTEVVESIDPHAGLAEVAPMDRTLSPASRDHLDGLLDARSPLLSRAFRNVRLD